MKFTKLVRFLALKLPHYSIFLVIPAIFMLAGCQLSRSAQELPGIFDWSYADLRAVDASDATQPGQDLVATYARLNGQSFQIRLDFLDLGRLPDEDIFIALDTNAGGRSDLPDGAASDLSTDIQWDYLVKIPPTGSVDFVNDRLLAVYGAELMIVRDHTLDCVVVSLDRNALPVGYATTRLQILIASRDDAVVLDKSAAFSLDAPSPARAKVIFAFWNTFNPYTPATTLRSWAGAHSGPRRSRHGLEYLLEQLEQAKYPVFLLDLLDQQNLPALDYIGAIPQIRSLVQRGNLVLPVFPSHPAWYSWVNYVPNSIENMLPGNMVINIKDETNYIDNYDNKISNLFLLLTSSVNKISSHIYFGVNDYAHNTNNYCPIAMNYTGATYSLIPLSLECRKLILSTSTGSPTLPLVLGGDFSTSVLGTPGVISDVFKFIDGHPWIQVITLEDLASSSNSSPSNLIPNVFDSPLVEYVPVDGASSAQQAVQEKIFNDLQKSPSNPLTSLAWEVYDRLTAPASMQLTSLRSNYLGSIGEIISAAQWAAQPVSVSTCAEDMDLDGINECVISNSNVYIIIDPDGGFIPFVFFNDDHGVHQVIGPSWELAVGLSDPSTWDLSAGMRSEPSQVLGAMAAPLIQFDKYDFVIDGNKIELDSVELAMRKYVEVFPNRFHLDIQVESGAMPAVTIPLIVDPWARYSSGWGGLYSGSQGSMSYTWGLHPGLQVKILLSSPIEVFPINASRRALQLPEDPNYDYGRGAYLPYPLTLLETNSGSSVSIDVIFAP